MKPIPFSAIVFVTILAACVFSQPAQAQEYHDNVVIVLDASGSMRERMPDSPLTRMDAAKAALKDVLAKVPLSTQVGLLQFSAADVTQDWIYPLGPRNEQALLQAIDRPNPGRGTPLGAFLKKAADRLLEERALQFGYGTYRLLVVTDGEASDRHLVDKYIPDIISRGIIVDVIGVDMRTDHALARQAHSYRRANDPESLRTAVSEVFAEVSVSGSDAVEEDAFDIIAGLPVETAAAALQALAVADNHPIGSRPFNRARLEPTPSPVPDKSPPQPNNPPPPLPPGRSLPIVPIIIGALVLAFVIKSLFGGGRR
jgi:uncharacterized protein YegL